ncbi:MAG: hypothetical protein JNK38_03045, partial [Acidobacteria bacterium]|nr:hypothetical protein [Acidobacteriota bacterium]
MFKPIRFNRFINAFAFVLFGVSSAMAQDQDTERRFWPPNYRPQAAKPSAKPATTPGYKRSTPALPKNAIPTAAERNSVVGITIWRLKPYQDVAGNTPKDHDVARILVVRKGKKSDLAAERVEASTAFSTGQMLRLSIEVPRSGYLYL